MVDCNDTDTWCKLHWTVAGISLLVLWLDVLIADITRRNVADHDASGMALFELLLERVLEKSLRNPQGVRKR